MKIFTGTSGYGYKEWKGNFYPAKLSAAKMLAFYSSRLGAVEINNSFYRMPTPKVVKSWASQVPEGFLFAVKAPMMITHIKRLQNAAAETKFFLDSVSTLGKKLGCVLFQFPANFKDNQDLLKDYLTLIPPDIPCAFDFRSDTWHNAGTIKQLKKRNFCLCLEDTDEKPLKDIINTADWGYLRMRKLDYTKADLKKLAKKALAQKWKKAFVFFKHEDEAAAKGPKLAEDFAVMAN